MASMAQPFAHPGAMSGHASMPHSAHSMGPAHPPNQGIPGGVQPGVSIGQGMHGAMAVGPAVPQVTQAGPMMAGMPPGVGVPGSSVGGPSAIALSHLNPQHPQQILQQQQQQQQMHQASKTLLSPMRSKPRLKLCHSHEQPSLDAASSYEVTPSETIQSADAAPTAESWDGRNACTSRYDAGSVQCYHAGKPEHASSQSTSSSPASNTAAASAAIDGPAATPATECSSSSTTSAAATTACPADGNAAEW